MKKLLSFVIFFTFSGFLFPIKALSRGLGEAGSFTFEALITGLAVVGVIFLVFMGLLLLARVRELASLEKNEKPTVHFVPEDVMNLNEEEIGKLLHDRHSKTNGIT